MGKADLPEGSRGIRVGILTFHCADNFGAMLQAYGLLTYLNQEGFQAFIINYAPFFLRGREWFIPYVPQENFLRAANTSLWYLKKNVKAGRSFFTRKRAMEDFRRTCLTKGQRPIRSLWQLGRIDADALVVGSDQIWNPDVTFGFRRAYFGAFRTDAVRKTVAYAASLGSASLRDEDEADFARLLSAVDDITLREPEAAEYVRNRFGRTAEQAVDPVFLLDEADWRSVAQRPEAAGYVFCYETQRCESLREAACRTAEKKGLRVVGLSLEGNEWGDLPIQTAPPIDPAEFVGYIDGADYVFTNSFHGLAFSVLLRKRFSVWNHTTVGLRLRNLLRITGLEARMSGADAESDIDSPIDWQEVQQCLKPYKDRSKEFLQSSLRV